MGAERQWSCNEDLDEPTESPPHSGLTWAGEVIRAVEGWARQELHQYAVTLRKLAYSQPNGMGEAALLQLSEQMNTTAGSGLADVLASLGLPDALRRLAVETPG